MAGDHTTFPATEVVIVMVPFVAQGHLTQLFHLSRLISSYNIPLHSVTTTTCIRQIRSRHLTSAAGNNIHFHEFTVPPFTTPPPHPSIHLRQSTADLRRSLSQNIKRVVVIHDFLMCYVVQDAKTIPNAVTYVFHPLAAFYRSSGHREKTSGQFPVDTDLMNDLPSRDGIASPEFFNFVNVQKAHMNFQVGELYDSSRVIEGVFFEYLEKAERKKIWAVGPFKPVQVASDVTDHSMNRHKCLQWLDKQPTNSVIYVCFETTTNFSDDQIKELAFGLERSGQWFLWVVRVADTGTHLGSKRGRLSCRMGLKRE